MSLSAVMSSGKVVVSNMIAGVSVTVQVDQILDFATASQMGNGSAITINTSISNFIIPGTITPGNWSSYTQPGDVPSLVGDPTSNGFSQAEQVIAAWEFVPYQVFSGVINIGVKLKNKDISGCKVQFAANGGSRLDISDATPNSQTANTAGVGTTNVDGVTEFWASLSATSVGYNGLVEIRAIGWPKDGIPTILGSTYVNANASNTLVVGPIYSSNAGSDSTGDGNPGTPFLTIAAAVTRATWAHISTHDASNSIINLAPGDYDYGGVSGGVFAFTPTGFVTIQSTNVSDRATTRITSSSTDTALNVSKVHLKNLTIYNCNIISKNDIGAVLWLDGCVLQGNGRSAGNISTIGFTGGVYMTNCEEKDFRNGASGGNLMRNVTVHNYGEDAFSTVPTVMANCEAYDGIPSPVDGNDHPHPDVLQFLGNVNGSIVDGLKATNNINESQGISFNGTSTNVAIDNVDIEMPDSSALMGLQAEFAWTNVLLTNSTISSYVDDGEWRVSEGDGKAFTAQNVFLRLNTFPNKPNNKPTRDDGGGTAVTGVNYL